MRGKMIEMLVPTIEVKKEEKGVAPRVSDLDNKVIGIVDNTWEHYIPFVARIEELLLKRYKSLRIVRKTKPEKSMGAPLDFIDGLATSCQVIINGVGAWGSCTTWSIHDSIQFEDRGIPTVTMVATPFMALAQAAAKAHSRPMLSMVELPYTIISISDQGARELADKSLEKIVNALTKRK